MKSARFGDALRALARHEVEFIVVGMAAGILQGVPLTTLDVDIVHRRTRDNVERLLGALTELQAVYRGDPRNLTSPHISRGFRRMPFFGEPEKQTERNRHALPTGREGQTCGSPPEATSRKSEAWRIEPNLALEQGDFSGPGHQLLTTVFGDLDCLGTVDGGKGYDELIGLTTELALSESRTVRVLELSSLIEVKRRAARPKDLAVIPFLEATLDEIRRKG